MLPNDWSHCWNSQPESETRNEFLVMKAATPMYFYPPSPIGLQGDGSMIAAPPCRIKSSHL